MASLSFHIRAVQALACVVLIGTSTISLGAEQKAYTPAKGSTERKALIDDVRAVYAAQDSAKPAIIFQVPYLKVHGDWAWLRLEPQSKDGSQRYEPQSGLFRRQNGKWTLVTWESSEEGSDAAAFFKQLKASHPSLPTDILPK